jgi:hypothetical protein
MSTKKARPASTYRGARRNLARKIRSNAHCSWREAWAHAQRTVADLVKRRAS